MKKILIVLMLTLSFALVPTPAAFAAERELIVDLAGVLTQDELDALTERAETITVEYKCDVVIVTVDEMTNNDGAYEWARYAYDRNGYGFGTDKSGILFFLSKTERDYALIAFGYGNTAFTDYGKDVMLDKHILPLLKDNKYYEAFSAYLDKSEEFLTMARNDKPFDRGTDPDNMTGLVVKLAAIILVPLLIALLVCSMWKKQMKTAVAARAAANYIPSGGFKLTGQTDMFLYRTQERRKVATQSSSSSGGTTKDSKGYSGRSGKF